MYSAWSRLQRVRPSWWMFGAGTVVYFVTRVWGLTRFPIYFFCDEAVQATLAEQLLNNGFRSRDGVFLPPYLPNADRYSLSASVYAQIPAVAFFGTTIAATRGTSVVIGLAGVAALAVIARFGFQLRAWWVAPLVLAAIPAWFLHSRTGFEVAIMVPMYACFLATYLLYRLHSPRYAPLAVAFGAATFYSYANGQGLMLATGLLLAISDIGYHRRVLRSRRVWLPALVAAGLGATPYIRERIYHPGAVTYHLRTLDSYWLRDGSLAHKLWTFIRTYLVGLDPRYWFSTHNSVDLDRHIMRGMGHVWWPLAPFVLVGLVTCVRRWRSPAHRLVLIAVVSSPVPAALVEVQITRVLSMVVPIAVLVMVGMDALLSLARDLRLYRGVAALLALALAMLGVGMTQTALADGPRWFDDYGLYGMQWGAGQVFPEIDRRLAADPDLHVVLSPGWANSTDVFVDFFVAPSRRSRLLLASIETYVLHREPLDASTLFVLTPADLELAVDSGKLSVSAPEAVIDWPDGRPGFIFTHLQYLPGVDAVFAAEEAARAKPVTESITVDGEPITVTHSVLDIGQVADIFDDDPFTLMRGLEANPFLLELTFATDHPLSTITLTTATMDYELSVVVTGASGDVVARTDQVFRDLPRDPTVRVDLPGAPVSARSVRLELRDLSGREDVHIHIRDIAWS